MRYKGSREAFITALEELVTRDERHMLVSADSMLAARARPFAERFCNNMVEVGIAEQCAVDVAAGLASAGLIPFVATYAGFLTMRACEQIRTFVAYPDLNVKLIGFNAGLLGGEREGVTHQFYEDIAILRSIPGISIVCPGDQSQVYQATMAIAAHDGPCYMRLASGREPVVFADDPPAFEFGKARILRDYGSDVAVFTHGFILDRALKAMEELRAEGIHGKLVEVHTIRPLDIGTITAVLADCGKAITFEDHYINGGLGSAIAEVIAEHQAARLIRIGLNQFAESGTPDDLLRHYGIDTPDIVKAAKELMRQPVA